MFSQGMDHGPGVASQYLQKQRQSDVSSFICSTKIDSEDEKS
jgi:hypothetical protein